MPPCLTIGYNNEAWLLGVACVGAKREWNLKSLRIKQTVATAHSLFPWTEFPTDIQQKPAFPPRSHCPSAISKHEPCPEKKEVTKDSGSKAGLKELQLAFPEEPQCYPL